MDGRISRRCLLFASGGAALTLWMVDERRGRLLAAAQGNLPIDVRLHVIPLTNAEKDAAGRPVKPFAVTPQEFAALVERANMSFAGTGIRLAFDPELDWAPLADTELNTDGPNMRQRCNQIAADIPGKVVCFLRWGSDGAPTGNGNAYPPPGIDPRPQGISDVTQNYVALPNRIAPNFGLLNQGNGSFLAHEMGHYLGLYHTFNGWTDLNGPIYGKFGGRAPTQSEADQAVIDFIMKNGGTAAALDGDGLADTPPDPSPVLYAAHNQNICIERTITVQGTAGGKSISIDISPDPENVMSYFAGCSRAGEPPSPRRFSAQQVARMKSTLRHPSRSTLVNSPKFDTRSLLLNPVVSRAADRLDLMATDVEGRVWVAYWRSSAPKWDHWRPVLFKIGKAYSPVHVVARDANKLDAVVAGTNGTVYTGAWERGVADGQWHGWWNILQQKTVAGGAVTAVVRGRDHLDVFAVGSDGRVYTAAWDRNAAGGRWQGWWPIGSQTARPGSRVAAVARDPSKLDVFVTGQDGRVYTAAWDQQVAGASWRGWWNVLDAVSVSGGSVTAVSRRSHQLDVFMAARDGRVYTAAWDQRVENGKWQGWWPVANLSTTPGAAVTAVNRDANKLDVFAAGRDGRVYTAAWDQNAAGAKWQGAWQIVQALVAPGSPIAAVSRDPNKLDIFVVGQEGHVHTAAWDQHAGGAQWRGWWPV